MAEVNTKVIMSNGNDFTLELDPAEVIEKFTNRDGTIKNEFIEIGTRYINPIHVAELIYEEEKKLGTFNKRGLGL